jgi:hypothetical protein
MTMRVACNGTNAATRPRNCAPAEWPINAYGMSGALSCARAQATSFGTIPTVQRSAGCTAPSSTMPPR